MSWSWITLPSASSVCTDFLSPSGREGSQKVSSQRKNLELSSDHIAQACVLLGLESHEGNALFLVSSSCTPGGYTEVPPQITLPGYFGLRSLAEQCCTAECSGSFRTQTCTDFLSFWVMPSPCLISLFLLNTLGKGISGRASRDLRSLPFDTENYI